MTTPDRRTGRSSLSVCRHWVAELDAEIRAARLLTLHAAWMIDRIYDGADEVHKTTLGRRLLRAARDRDRSVPATPSPFASSR